MDKSTRMLLIVALVGLLAVIVAVGYVWNSLFGETEFDRQYRENLEKSKAYSEQAQPAGAIPD